MKVTFLPVRSKPGVFEAVCSNGANVGVGNEDIDGYVYFWPKHPSGHLSAGSLRAIADALDAVNANWDARVKREIGARLYEHDRKAVQETDQAHEEGAEQAPGVARDGASLTQAPKAST